MDGEVVLVVVSVLEGPLTFIADVLNVLCFVETCVTISLVASHYKEWDMVLSFVLLACRTSAASRSGLPSPQRPAHCVGGKVQW